MTDSKTPPKDDNEVEEHPLNTNDPFESEEIYRTPEKSDLSAFTENSQITSLDSDGLLKQSSSTSSNGIYVSPHLELPQSGSVFEDSESFSSYSTLSHHSSEIGASLEDIGYFNCRPVLSSPTHGRETHKQASERLYTTSRYTHVQDRTGHYVITGRKDNITRCEDEPIHCPGAVQGFGVMIVLDLDDDTSNLTVRQVSENSTELLGLSPQYLFSLNCFTQVLPDSQADLLWNFIHESDTEDCEIEDPKVFLLCGWGQPNSLQTDSEDSDSDGLERHFWTCWCAIHRPPLTSSVEGNPESLVSPLIILEFELERDDYNPLYPLSSDDEAGILSADTSLSNTIVASSPIRGDSPVDAFNMTELFLSSEPGLEGKPDWFPTTVAINDSTLNHSKPIRALTRMRNVDRTRGSTSIANDGSLGHHQMRNRARASAGGARSGVGTLDVFAVLRQIDDQLSSATDMEGFLDIVVGIVKDLTQFHRVLVYQFDDQWNGKVVAELMDWRRSHDVYKGLSFPASDIPPQARELYKINKVRLLYDRSALSACLVVRDKKDLENPLDMTYSYLRAMSPIHSTYLKNMGVRSSMSISIVAFGELWGLITCHSYGDKGMRVSFPIRHVLRLLSESVSRNVERLSNASRLLARKLIRTRPTESHPSGFIVSDVDDLLETFDAEFGALMVGRSMKMFGNDDHQEEVVKIVEHLRQWRPGSLQASHCIKNDYPDLMRSSDMHTISGLLYIPLTQGGINFIVFMRRGQTRNVQWAGRPYKNGEEDRSVLEPRKSFKIWREQISDQSKPWTDVQMETAGVFGIVYGKFIEIWQQKENHFQNNTKMVDIILSNADHEIRTPLNHIINYLELALNQPLDSKTRNNLEKSHSVSKSLLFSINDLLDLARTQNPDNDDVASTFDIFTLLENAVEPFKAIAENHDIQFEVRINVTSRQVYGDKKQIKTIITGLLANAFERRSGVTIRAICQTDDESMPEAIDEDRLSLIVVVSDMNSNRHASVQEEVFKLDGLESGVESLELEESAPINDNLMSASQTLKQLGGQLRISTNPDGGTRISAQVMLRACDNSMKMGTRFDDARRASNEMFDLAQSVPISPTKLSQNCSRQNSLELTEVEKSEHIEAVLPVENVKVEELCGEELSRGDFSDHGSNDTIQDQLNTNSTTRVLIVDDDLINRTVLQKRLIKDGYIAITAVDGPHCLDLLQLDRDIDCVLMDIQMPVLSGFETSKRIRCMETQPDSTNTPIRASKFLNGRIPILAVSASLKEHQQDDMISSGMDGWIMKPISFKRLQELLSGILNPAQRKKDTYLPGYKWENGGWLKKT